jgi:hypothetical protein
MFACASERCVVQGVSDGGGSAATAQSRWPRSLASAPSLHALRRASLQMLLPRVESTQACWSPRQVSTRPSTRDEPTL